jgi:hypothetical protein
LLTSCTTVAVTKKGAVGFNRVFADARNEVLLLNILRARDGEPLQFSTVSTVSGAMRPEMKLTGGLDNLILGAANVFNPAGEFGFRNPSITIAPLETKEFRQGMAKPVSIEFVDELLAEGWDSATVLHLVVDKFDCELKDSKGTVSGPQLATVEFANAASWSRPDNSSKADFGEPIRVTAAEGAKILREGVGEGVTVEMVAPKQTDAPGTVGLKFIKKKPAKFIVKNVPCGAITKDLFADQLIMRSPLGMIKHLGAIVRGGGSNPYFKVIQNSKIPQNALVGTRFRHNLYYIEQGGNSPQTLAVLAEIIGFQTTDASLNASKPTLTVSQD